MDIIVAIIFAINAIVAGAPVDEKPTYPNEVFVQGMVEWGTPANIEGFHGMVWVCDPAEAGLEPTDVEALRAAALDRENGVAEICYAGWALSDPTDPESELVPTVGP